MSRSHFVPAAGLHLFTPIYDALCAVVGFGTAFRDRLAHELEPGPRDRVLDIGCGTGVLAARIAARIPQGRVAGIDPDVRALRIATKRATSKGARVGLVAAMGQQLPFADASFDRVVTSLAFHHVPDAAKAGMLREARRVLRPLGVFLLADFDTARSRIIPRGRRSRLLLEQWLAEGGWEAEHLGTWRRAHLWRARAKA